MKTNLLSLLLLIPVVICAQNYAFDPSFSQDGYDVTDYFKWYDNDQAPRNVHVVDGKIILCQKTQVSAYTDAGIPDYTFGNMAMARITMPGFAVIEITNSKIIEGKILVYGRAWSSNAFRAFIARINFDGTFDNTFATNGLFIYEMGGVEHEPYSDGVTDLAYKDGFYYAFSSRYTPNGPNTFVLKLDSQGSLVPSFGANGIKDFVVSHPHRSRSIFVYQDDLLLISGTNSSYSATLFLKVDESGNPVPAFGNNGEKRIVFYDNCNCGEGIFNCNLAGDILFFNRSYGSWSVSGRWFQSLNLDSIQAISPAASLPFVNFGNFNVTSHFVDDTKLYSLKRCELGGQPGEPIYCIGPEGFILSRYNFDGSADETFGQNGILALPIPTPAGVPSADVPSAFAKTDEGFVMTGYKSTQGGWSTPPNTGMVVARIIDESLLDTESSRSQKISVAPNPTSSEVYLNNPEAVSIKQLTILSIDGKILNVLKGDDSTIDFSSFPSGLYILRVRSEKGTQEFKILRN